MIRCPVHKSPCGWEGELVADHADPDCPNVVLKCLQGCKVCALCGVLK